MNVRIEVVTIVAERTSILVEMAIAILVLIGPSGAVAVVRITSGHGPGVDVIARIVAVVSSSYQPAAGVVPSVSVTQPLPSGSTNVSSQYCVFHTHVSVECASILNGGTTDPMPLGGTEPVPVQPVHW